eukprot:SAG31_NODE_1513_length_8045_cov_5.748804_1_plen_31_part_00
MCLLSNLELATLERLVCATKQEALTGERAG